MNRYEYKVQYGRPAGIVLFPWASKEHKDRVAPGSFERKLNELAEQGWVVVSCTTASEGSFLFFHSMATVVLQREIDEAPTSQSI